MPSVEVHQMLAAAAAACEDKKAEDIRILALDPAESGLTDYFLICTGTNDRQTVAITDEIEIRLKREYGTYPNSVEGRRQGEWILMDYVDFIVHVFLPEKRAFYGLERLRPSATSLSVNSLNADIKAAIKAHRPAKGIRAASADEAEAEPKPARKTAGKAAGRKTASPAKRAISATAARSTKGAAKGAAKRASKTASRPSVKAAARAAASPAEGTAAKAPAKSTRSAAKKTAAKAPAKRTSRKRAAGSDE